MICPTYFDIYKYIETFQEVMQVYMSSPFLKGPVVHCT